MKLTFATYDKIGGRGPRASFLHCFLSNRDQVSDKRCLEKSSCAQGFSSDIKYKKIEGEGSRASVLFSRYSRTKYNRIKQSQLFKSDHDKGPRTTEDSSSENNRAKIALGEGSHAQLNVPHSNHYVASVLSQGTFLSRTLKQRLRICSPNLRSSRGAVLIEFAVCMPILIILLFYIYDLMKLKRWYSQTEFVAQQFANVIQNISQKSEDRRITMKHIQHAFGLAHLSISPGYALYSKGRLVYFPELFMTYVVGNSDGTASCKWCLNMWGSDHSSPNFSNMYGTSGHVGSLVTFQQNVEPAKIYPSLKINPGEEKLIIESSMKFHPDEADYTGHKVQTAKEAFGYFFYNVQPTKSNQGLNRRWYYHSAVIFTPKKGLFNETHPS